MKNDKIPENTERDINFSIISKISSNEWPSLSANEFCNIFNISRHKSSDFIKAFLNENPLQLPSQQERFLIAVNGLGDSVGKIPFTTISIFLNCIKENILPNQQEFTILCKKVWEQLKWWQNLSEEQQIAVLTKVKHRFWSSHMCQLLFLCYLHEDLYRHNCTAYISAKKDVKNNNDFNIKYNGTDLEYGIGYRFTSSNTTKAEKARGLKRGRGIWYNIDIPLKLWQSAANNPRIRDLRIAGNMLIPAHWDIDHIRRDMLYDIIAIETGNRIKNHNERLIYYTAII